MDGGVIKGRVLCIYLYKMKCEMNVTNLCIHTIKSAVKETSSLIHEMERLIKGTVYIIFLRWSRGILKKLMGH